MDLYCIASMTLFTVIFNTFNSIHSMYFNTEIMTVMELCKCITQVQYFCKVYKVMKQMKSESSVTQNTPVSFLLF